MVWALPTRARPELCQVVLDACAACGMTAPGVLWVDAHGAEAYRGMRVPRNWLIHVERADLQAAKQQVYEWFPDEAHYGLVLDDTVPQTPEFDVKMEEAAGRWHLVDTEDRWMAGDRGGDLTQLLGAYCWGGALVRAVGSWVLPGGWQHLGSGSSTINRAEENVVFNSVGGSHQVSLNEIYLTPQYQIGSAYPQRQAGCDNAWSEHVTKPLDLRKRLRDVVFDHRNWRTGRRPKDETDSWEREGYNYVEADFEILRRWLAAGEHLRVQARVREAMAA